MIKPSALVVNLYDVDRDDAQAVGEKAANLGEMLSADFPVPPGFVVTAKAFSEFLKHNNLEKKIDHLIGTVNFQNTESLSQVSSHIVKLVLGSEIPEKVVNAVFDEYEKIGLTTRVAVRLSGEGFDENEAILNIRGEAHLAEKIKTAWSLHFSPELIFMRNENKSQKEQVRSAVIVERMISPQVKGVATSIDPETSDKTRIIIETGHDRYIVEKKSLEILKIDTSGRQKLTDLQIFSLAKLSIQIEKHFYFPQVVDWAKEGDSIYVLRLRPVTTLGATNTEDRGQMLSGRTILIGHPASSGIGVGPVKKVSLKSEISAVRRGDVLVTKFFDQNFTEVSKHLSAVIVEETSKSNHLYRDIGIPVVTAAPMALSRLSDGQIVTVNGKTGEVLKGGFVASTTGRNDTLRTVTKLTAHIYDGESGIRAASSDFDEVGLLQAESLIMKSGIHPRKMLNDGLSKEFSEILIEYLVSICRPFYPRPVFYKTLDFVTSEYRNLLGGKGLEHIEENPILGYRGAFRYIRDAKVIKLEIDTLKLVREKYGLNNLNLKVPFVRTVAEIETVKKYIGLRGLRRSGTFKIGMLAEVPSNVILSQEFASVGIDEISISLKSLINLIYGVDISNSEFADEFGVRSDAILPAVQSIISACRKNHVSVSICYDFPSISPSFIESLVHLGIDAICIKPDSVDQVRRIVYGAEEKQIVKSKYV